MSYPGFVYDEDYYMSFQPGDVITNTLDTCPYTTYWNGREIQYDTKTLAPGNYTIAKIWYGLYDNVEFFELVGITTTPNINPEYFYQMNHWPVSNPFNGFFAGRFVKFPTQG